MEALGLAGEEGEFPPSGPCCWALERYEAKELGRSWVGEAGCACGVWSAASVGRRGRWSVTIDVGEERREGES
jgi:hypothetical protein